MAHGSPPFSGHTPHWSHERPRRARELHPSPSKSPSPPPPSAKEAADIRRLKPIGVAGVIVGRSLYEGTLTLKDALAAAK